MSTPRSPSLPEWAAKCQAGYRALGYASLQIVIIGMLILVVQRIFRLRLVV
jgi:hypothetical protein